MPFSEHLFLLSKSNLSESLGLLVAKHAIRSRLRPEEGEDGAMAELLRPLVAVDIRHGVWIGYVDIDKFNVAEVRYLPSV